MRARARWIRGVVALAIMCGCGRGEEPRPSQHAPVIEDAAPQTPPAPPVARALPPLGFDRLERFAYRRGAGRAQFQRAAAAARRGDWKAAARWARGAITTDAGHLEAQWLLARARVELGEIDQARAPLVAAIAGDWFRWGPRALEEPALAAIRAGQPGASLRVLIDRAGDQLRVIAREGIWVVGRRGRVWPPRGRGATTVNHRAEVYLYDRARHRYVRVSRTGGGVVGYVRAPVGSGAAYVAYRSIWLPPKRATGATKVPRIRVARVGLIDPDGRSTSVREVEFRDVIALEVGFVPGATGHERAGAGGAAWALVARVWHPAGPGLVARAQTYRLDPDHGTREVVTDRVAYADMLRVTVNHVSLRRYRVDGVIADWDRAGVAGAFMLAETRKTITPAEGLSVSRHTLRWSARDTYLAFTTVAAEPCPTDRGAPRAGLYVVEAATGAVRAIARGTHAFAPLWLDDTQLAYVAWPRGATPRVRVFDVARGRTIDVLDARGGLGTQWIPRPVTCGSVTGDDAAIAPPADRPDDDGAEWDDDGIPARVDERN